MYTNQNLYNNIRELNLIDEKKLQEALVESDQKNILLGNLLLDKDLISDQELGRIVAELYKVPFVNLSTKPINEDVLHLIPEVVAKKQSIIAFKKDQQGLHVALSDPHNIQIVDFIRKKVGLPVVIYYATNNDIGNTLSQYSKNMTQAFDDIIKHNIAKLQGNKEGVTDAPIAEIVDTIISYAYKNKTSDIHIEPGEEYSLVRFRIDGVLHDIVNIPKDLHEQVVMRIKVMSLLRTDEHQSAQDGKIRTLVEMANNKETLDIRVSIVPVVRGEKIVMRLLSEHSRQFSLTNLGFSNSDMEKVKDAYSKPFGMLLATGPTGSGKTTTMYAILKLLNTRDVNIMTIEDPVEYDIPGISQIQVNPKTNLTFEAGLRSILRQDPNIILVGEIRDPQTADIAVNAAMTGHLVLSTLHTNDAATAIPRLSDMHIEPFLIASTVNIIIAQRLIRKICVSCRVSFDYEIEKLKQHFDIELIRRIFSETPQVRLYKGKGCAICHNTGYEDRIGIFETLIINDQIREAIIGQKDATTVRKLAIDAGMKPMVEDGLDKVSQGLTTIEEVIRATQEETT